MTDRHELTFDRATELARSVVEILEDRVLGQSTAIRELVAAYLAGGHVLVQGVPGLGKTLLARSFASCLGLDFARVQFTPDLMPADVVGTSVFDTDAGRFELHRGPVFTDILLADEINRTPPKTQSALLEAMQECQATIDGTAHALPAEFFVVATLNPLEFEGVYPLPEAQLDRFLLRVGMTLPSAEGELEIYRRAVAGTLAGWGEGRSDLPPPAMSPAEARALRRACGLAHVRDDLVEYLAALAREVRSSPRVELGVSPRGVLALLTAARGFAVVEGRDFLVPDDVKAALPACWGHRLVLTPEAELEGYSPAAVLRDVLDSVPVPR